MGSLKKTDPIKLVFHGDSLLFGLDGRGAQDWAVHLRALCVAYGCTDITASSFGVSGQKLKTMINTTGATVDAALDSLRYNILFVEADVNAILNYFTDPANAALTGLENYQDMAEYATDRKAAGFNEVITLTGAYPRLFGDPLAYNNAEWTEDRIQEFKAYKDLCNEVLPSGVDKVLDLSLNPYFGGGIGQTVNDQYLDDGIHQNSVGYLNKASWIFENTLKNRLV